MAERESETNVYNNENINTEFSDAIPEPIYRPETSETVAPMTNGFSDTDLLNFIPPKAPISGTPSAETLNKLKAVAKTYKGDDVKNNKDITHIKDNQEKPDDSLRAIPQALEQEGFEKSPKTNSRFGINNLINRMTGASSSISPSLEVEQGGDDINDTIKDNIEIPAFLRRQAN